MTDYISYDVYVHWLHTPEYKHALAQSKMLWRKAREYKKGTL